MYFDGTGPSGSSILSTGNRASAKNKIKNVYIYIYIYMYVCMYVYMYVCMYVCMSLVPAGPIGFSLLSFMDNTALVITLIQRTGKIFGKVIFFFWFQFLGVY